MQLRMKLLLPPCQSSRSFFFLLSSNLYFDQCFNRCSEIYVNAHVVMPKQAAIVAREAERLSIEVNWGEEVFPDLNNER